MRTSQRVRCSALKSRCTSVNVWQDDTRELGDQRRYVCTSWTNVVFLQTRCQNWSDWLIIYLVNFVVVPAVAFVTIDQIGKDEHCWNEAMWKKRSSERYTLSKWIRFALNFLLCCCVVMFCYMYRLFPGFVAVLQKFQFSIEIKIEILKILTEYLLVSGMGNTWMLLAELLLRLCKPSIHTCTFLFFLWYILKSHIVCEAMLLYQQKEDCGGKKRAWGKI